MYPIRMNEDYITRNLISNEQGRRPSPDGLTYKQLSLFDDYHMGEEESQWKSII